MVQIAIITGGNRLTWWASDLGDFYFLLAQYGDNDAYVNYYSEKNRFKILDNGLYEKREACSVDWLLETARKLHVDEVIVPDVLYNAESTVKSAESFFNSISQKETDEFNWMAVPQGKTARDWLVCHKALVEMPDINTIGLSKLSIPECFGGSVRKSRKRCFASIDDYWEFKLTIRKTYHCLGLGNPIEVSEMPSWVRSCDSSIAYYKGKHGTRFSTVYGCQEDLSSNHGLDDNIPSIYEKDVLFNIALLHKWSKVGSA